LRSGLVGKKRELLSRLCQRKKTPAILAWSAGGQYIEISPFRPEMTRCHPHRESAMLIPLRCSCGRELKLKEELAGKKIRCPQCKAICAVPEILAEVEEEEPVLEVLPAEEAEGPPRRKTGRTAIQVEPPEVLPVARPAADDAISARPLYRSKDEDRPRKRRRPKLYREDKRSAPLVAFEPGWFGSVNSGVAGGLLMILIAVVWFGLGLAAGRIFFYPPILFVIGLIAIFKGCLGGS
jgi:hypothetical protein